MVETADRAALLAALDRTAVTGKSTHAPRGVIIDESWETGEEMQPEAWCDCGWREGARRLLDAVAALQRHMAAEGRINGVA